MMKNNIAFLVFKKELKDTFRDRKTIIMSVLIPLLIFPIMFYFMGKSMNNTSKKIENNLKIAIVDEGNSSLGKFLKEQKDIKLTESSNIASDVKEGKLLVALEIPKDFDSTIGKEMQEKVTITYDNSSQQSQMVKEKINAYINQYTQGVVGERLAKRDIDPTILTPVQVETKTAVKESEGSSKLILSLILPLLLLIYCVTGPMAAAVDQGAGEKERGTLEPLLTTQASRLSLLWGKFFAITVLGFMTTAASIGGLIIATRQNSEAFGGKGALSIDITSIFLVGIVALLVTMVFGALELSISIYARSFKEAQTYITPLMILAFIPAYGTYMLDAKNIENFYFHIPLANAACLMKEFISGIYNYTHIATTLVWIIVYIVASLLFARYMFSKEEVIFRT